MSRPQKGVKPMAWQKLLAHVPNAAYFESLKNPASINHLGYFRFCTPLSSMKANLTQTWLSEVLPAIQNCERGSVSQELTRLRAEWTRDVGLTEAFWQELQVKEVEQRENIIDQEQTLNLKENATAQLGAVYEYYTGKARDKFAPPLEKDSERHSHPSITTGQPADVKRDDHDRPDDISQDSECDAQDSNIERSPSTKKRKSSTQFTDDRRKSLQRRYSSLGEKWTLKSGTVVEDILYEAGKQMKDFHPIHSFMLDLSDEITQGLFSKEDWIEICSNLPDVPPYPKEASDYMDRFECVETLKDLQDLLEIRPRHLESQLIHECLMNWLYLYESDDPSPFNVAGRLSEGWWLKSAWGVCTDLAKGVSGCFIIPGEITGHDSSARRNNDRESTCGNERKRMGVRADLVWRTVTLPETDWAIAEAAKVWSPQDNKYISESKFKLPRQLHDVLVGRTMEVGGANELRDVLVSGLIIGGPCIQRVGVCWGAAGDNVTRLIKLEPTRLDAKIRHLSTSLLAIHELLCFRTSTIQLISQYELAAKRHADQKKQDRGRSLTSALLGPRVLTRASQKSKGIKEPS